MSGIQFHIGEVVAVDNRDTSLVEGVLPVDRRVLVRPLPNPKREVVLLDAEYTHNITRSGFLAVVVLILFVKF